ncbi:hypothetical protein SZN_38093, partial [Streptomyces zinciresistens K42]
MAAAITERTRLIFVRQLPGQRDDLAMLRQAHPLVL